VRAVVNGAEQAASAPALQFPNGYLDVPIRAPPGGTTPTGEAYTYSANGAARAGHLPALNAQAPGRRPRNPLRRRPGAPHRSIPDPSRPGMPYHHRHQSYAVRATVG
jgi:hypothetical protein